MEFLVVFSAVAVLVLMIETVLRLIFGDPYFNKLIRKHWAHHEKANLQVHERLDSQHKNMCSLFDVLEAKFIARTGGVTEAELEKVFSYHAPSPNQINRMEGIRNQCHELGKVLLRDVPMSIELESAISQLETVSMFANAGIVRREPRDPDDIPF